MLKSGLSVAFCFVCLLASPYPLPAMAATEYLVASCNDGDTCRLDNGSLPQIKVRLMGIDAPECTKGGQPFCKESKDYLNRLVVGKKVKLESKGTDVYGRVLGILQSKDLDINESMIKAGMAEVYVGKSAKSEPIARYLAAQEQAKNRRKGMWSQLRYESPYQFRKRMR